MLSNFQLGAHPLLQTLLLGQPEFKRLLAGSDELEQLRQRVIAAHHLEAMQPGEIEPYVRHRLNHVGWDGEPDFERGLFTRMHKATGGIPRKINQVMTRLLLLGAVEEQSTIDLAMLEAVIDEMAATSAKICRRRACGPTPAKRRLRPSPRRSARNRIVRVHPPLRRKIAVSNRASPKRRSRRSKPLSAGTRTRSQNCAATFPNCSRRIRHRTQAFPKPSRSVSQPWKRALPNRKHRSATFSNC